MLEQHMNISLIGHLNEMNNEQRNRVLDWIKDTTSDQVQTTDSDSESNQTANVQMEPNEILVMMCPLCKTTRFATKRKWQLNAFRTLKHNTNKYRMKMKFGVSLCARHENMYEEMAPSVNTKMMMDMNPFKRMWPLMLHAVCLHTNRDGASMKIMTPDETNNLCTNLYMIPIIIMDDSMDVLPHEHLTSSLNS